MTRTSNTPLCATAAIAAALAFVPITATAQEAVVAPLEAPVVAAPVPVAPTVSVPEVAAPAQPRPVIVLPQEAVAPAEPVAETPRVAEPAAPAPVARTNTPSAVARTTATPSPVVAEPASAPQAAATTAEMIADNAPTAATPDAEPMPPIASASTPEPMASTALDAENSVDEALLAGLAGVLAVGAAGFLALRSRRRARDVDLIDARSPVLESVEPAPRPSVHYADAPTETVPVETASPGVYAAAPLVATRTMAPAASANLADGPVPIGAERLALLDRMVAADPDEANPFTSHHARRRRARMILQHRESLARDAASDGFDFRTYTPSTKQAATFDREPAMA